MFVAIATSMCVPIVIVLSKWQGTQPNRFLKRNSPRHCEVRSNPQLYSAAVQEPLHSLRLLLAMTIIEVSAKNKG